MNFSFGFRFVSIAAALCGVGTITACENKDVRQADENNESVRLEVAKRDFDPESGKALFVDKGCVICHSVNGVGGKAAPPLDAEIGVRSIDALEFASRMWRGAPAMIELQSIELGYSIYLTADEMADLAAFASDREAQKTLKLEDLPETTRNGLLDEQFWEVEDWDEYLGAGREGDIPSVDEPEDEAQGGDQPE